MLVYALAYASGTLVSLSPCVLPVLPMIAAGAMREDKAGPALLALGLAVSFTGFGLLVLTLGHQIGFDQNSFRLVGAWLILIFGLILSFSFLERATARIMASIAQQSNQLMARFTFKGRTGQFALGALLGAVWSPCVGPSLGAAFGLASQGESLNQAGLTMLAFGLGTATPLLAYGYLARLGMNKYRSSIAGYANATKKVLGVSLVLVGVLVLSGLDKVIEMHLTSNLPDWWLNLITKF